MWGRKAGRDPVLYLCKSVPNRWRHHAFLCEQLCRLHPFQRARCFKTTRKSRRWCWACLMAGDIPTCNRYCASCPCDSLSTLAAALQYFESKVAKETRCWPEQNFPEILTARDSPFFKHNCSSASPLSQGQVTERRPRPSALPRPVKRLPALPTRTADEVRTSDLGCHLAPSKLAEFARRTCRITHSSPQIFSSSCGVASQAKEHSDFYTIFLLTVQESPARPSWQWR